MFIIFYGLRTCILPELVTFQMYLYNTMFEVSISKDFLAGFIGLFMRLGLKGFIENIFEELSSSQKLPIGHILMAEQDNGGEDSSSNHGPDADRGEGSSSNTTEKQPKENKGKGVITDSDFECESDHQNPEDNRSDHSDSNRRPLPEADKLVNGDRENIKTAPRETLEAGLQLARFHISNIEKFVHVSPILKEKYELLADKESLIEKELEKIRKGEREDVVKEDKGKGKAKD